MPPQRFLFVDNSQQEQCSSQGRRDVRSFVMQRARRERPWSTSKQGGKDRISKRRPARGSASASPESDFDLKTPPRKAPPLQDATQPTQLPSPALTVAGRSPVSHCRDCNVPLPYGPPLCERCAMTYESAWPQPYDLVADGVFDPFRAFPVETDHETSELLNHYFTVFSPGSLPLDIRKQFTLLRSDYHSTALSHRGFMHSVLCATALHLNMMGSKEKLVAVQYHQRQAILELQSTIADPVLRFSDGNIGAVFSLLCVAEGMLSPTFRSTEVAEFENERKSHMTALVALVEQRGGFHELYSSRYLQALILWHSTAHSVASFYPPYISAFGWSFDPSRLLLTNRIREQDSVNVMLDMTKRLTNDRGLVHIVEALAHYNADLTDWFNDSAYHLDVLDVQNIASALQCLLVQWMNEPQLHTRPSSESVLCIALLIFVVRISDYQDRASATLHYTATKRLQEAFEQADGSDWNECKELLVWCAAIGAIGALGSTESTWYIDQLRYICDQNNIVTYYDFHIQLRQCLWQGAKLDGMAEQVWEQVETLRLELGIIRYDLPNDRSSLVVPTQTRSFDIQDIDIFTSTPSSPQFTSAFQYVQPLITVEGRSFNNPVLDISEQPDQITNAMRRSKNAPPRRASLKAIKSEENSAIHDLAYPLDSFVDTIDADGSWQQDAGTQEYYNNVEHFANLPLTGYPLGAMGSPYSVVDPRLAMVFQHE